MGKFIFRVDVNVEKFVHDNIFVGALQKKGNFGIFLLSNEIFTHETLKCNVQLDKMQ